MSLSIEVYALEGEGSDRLPSAWSRPFGAETTRRTVWASPVLRLLGLDWLPRLANESFIEVQDEDLAELDREARLVLENLGRILPSSAEADYMRARLEFLLEACALARTLGPWGTVNVG